MAIIRKGKPLTPSQQKAYVQKLTGWDTKEYNKQYDKLRNRVRNFERANNYSPGSINVADLLAQSQSRKYYGDRPTVLFQAIERTTSAGTATKLSGRAIERATRAGEIYIKNRYRGALERSQLTQATYERFMAANPNASIREQEEVIVSAIRGSQSLGRAAAAYADEMGRQGIIIPYMPESP